MNRPIFEIVTTTAGAVSIRNNVVNEIMHNPVGPWVEANALYIEQSELARRLGENLSDEFVIFDVGLGAAANALAALHCIRQAQAQGRCRPVRLVSFEIDLDLLRFALQHAHEFEHFKGYETMLAELLEKSYWSEPGLIWELRTGDFLQLIETEPHKAHLIFYDPYSPKKNKDMWGLKVFAKLRRRSRELHEGGTVMYTYSQATPIRAALLASGFHVGYGTATGLKEETTQAATVREFLPKPLDVKWLNRWKASQAPYPYDASESDRASVSAAILNQHFESGTIQPNSSLSKPR